MPNADAAQIALNLLKVLGGGVPVGPILIGAARPVHIASQSVTARGLLNLTAIAVVQAQDEALEEPDSRDGRMGRIGENAHI
jgi:malate dehydrogenase (oxaloacetate-decarboxylating)(NADP+)